MAKKKASDLTVAIFAGHGKNESGTWDPGCVYGGYTEAELVLPITKAAAKALKRIGFNVITDALDGNKINMKEQVKKSNKNKADIHLTIHLDWSGAPKGTFPIVASKEGKKMATCVNKAVMKRTGMTTRGIQTSDAFYETNATNMPATIFEAGAIKADLSRVKKAEVYGEAIAEGICDYFGVKYTTGVPFKVKTRGNLIIRKKAALTSAKVGTAKKGIYTIVEVSSNGKRGKLKSGAGWITITEKYCERL